MDACLLLSCLFQFFSTKPRELWYGLQSFCIVLSQTIVLCVECVCVFVASTCWCHERYCWVAVVYSERDEDQRSTCRLLLHNHVTHWLTARLCDTLCDYRIVIHVLFNTFADDITVWFWCIGIVIIFTEICLQHCAFSLIRFNYLTLRTNS